MKERERERERRGRKRDERVTDWKGMKAIFSLHPTFNIYLWEEEEGIDMSSNTEPAAASATTAAAAGPADTGPEGVSKRKPTFMAGHTGDPRAFNHGMFCDEERQNSMNCLDVNNYDKTKCSEFFQAYKDCKKTWNASKPMKSLW